MVVIWKTKTNSNVWYFRDVYLLARERYLQDFFFIQTLQLNQGLFLKAQLYVACQFVEHLNHESISWQLSDPQRQIDN